MSGDGTYDGRPNSVKEAEDALVCKLRSSPILYKLANKILFHYIQLAKTVGITRREMIYFIGQQTVNPERSKRNSTRRRVSLSLRQYTFKVKGDAIVKNGYNCKKYNCEAIIDCKSEAELLEFNIKHNISLLQITSAFYIFQRNPKVINYCIRENPILQTRVLKVFRDLFSVPNSFTFSDLDALVSKSYGTWFYPWLVLYGNTKSFNLPHRNLYNDPDYVRKRMGEIKKASNLVLNKKSGCLADQYNSNIKSIVKGTTYYRPTINGVWWNLNKKYKKLLIAGPSGSSILFYDMIFNVTRILKPTFRNKRYALELLIADYYPTYHSLSEILQVYTEDAKFPKYSLDMNDLEYLRRIGIR